MALTPNSIVTVQTPKLALVQFSTVDTPGVLKQLIQGGANGTKITGIYATSNDAGAAHLATLQIQRSGVNYVGVAVSVAANSGAANGTPPVNLMSTAVWPGLPTDSDGNPFLFLQSTLDILMATYGTTLTTGNIVTAQAVAGDF